MPQNLTFRVDPELLERVDCHIKRLSRRAPGVKLTRSDAARALLTAALDAEEEAERQAGPEPKGKKPKK